jgi:calcium-dependent protein kinase
LKDSLTAFRYLDRPCDGVLNKEELVIGFEKLYPNKTNEECWDIVNGIFAKIDIDGNGTLEYSEWVIATIDKHKLMTPEKLEAAF